MLLYYFIILLSIIKVYGNAVYEYDPNGYVIFCLCMGRFGNQAEHFLGSMSFAKNINRTFVVPPFITYKNVPYKEWFKLERLSEFHRIISAEEFMLHIAPKYWPAEKRYGFCWGDMKCNMKYGNPSTNFWTELGVDNFVKDVNFQYGFNEYHKWQSNFPASKYPVIALKGAPAHYPMMSADRINQKYMVWSDNINAQAEDYLNKTFQSEKFVGIHLRNGEDWANACSMLDTESFDNYMASPQCLENSHLKVNKNLCFPSHEIVLNDLEHVLTKVLNNTVKNIYIATDRHAMIKEINARFKGKLLKVVHHDPWLPVLDLAILARSEYFIGNCVSSFTAFVKRERDINNKPSSFWAFTNKI